MSQDQDKITNTKNEEVIEFIQEIEVEAALIQME